MKLHNFRRARATAIAVGAATAILISTGVAAADPAVQPGTETPATTQPGTTTPDPEPAPAHAPEPAAEPVQQATYTPPPAAEPVPQPVSNVVPQITQQPIQTPEPEYITRYVEVPGEDRVVTETVLVSQPQGEGLYIGTREGSRHVTPQNVMSAAQENYQDREFHDRDKLTQVGAAGALGAAGGGLVGAGVGTLVGGAAGAAGGFVAGGIPAALTAWTPIGPITATGATVTGIAGGIAGAGAGAVAGGTAGAAGGGAAAINAVPGGTEAAQLYAADVVHTVDNDAREDDGYAGLVGDRPSGLPGYNDVDEDANLDNSILGESDGRHSTGEEAPAPEAESEPRHAAPEPAAEDTAPATPEAPVEVPEQLPELPEPYDQVNQAVEDTQQVANDAGAAVGKQVNGAVDAAQDDFADAVTGGGPQLPELPDLPF